MTEEETLSPKTKKKVILAIRNKKRLTRPQNRRVISPNTRKINQLNTIFQRS